MLHPDPDIPALPQQRNNLRRLCPVDLLVRAEHIELLAVFLSDTKEAPHGASFVSSNERRWSVGMVKEEG